MPRKLDAFTRAYIEAMLWSTNDESDEQGGEPLDKNYSADDIAPETMELIVEDCADFQERFGHLIEDEPEVQGEDRWNRWELAGHDFWLTRTESGAGFWDGDWPEHGDELSDASKAYGSFDLTVDDGVIYGPDAEWYREHRKPKPVASETRRARHVVRDFGTLPELVEHAGQQDGATHVVVLGKKASLFYPTGRYWPSGEPQYEAGKVWHQGGYWHSVAPSARSPLTGGLPGGAESIEAYLAKTGQRTAEAKRSGRSRGTTKSAAQVAEELSKRVGGSTPKPVRGGAVQFTTYSPEYSQKIVVVVDAFNEGGVSLSVFSDEGLSETARYENISDFTYGPGGYTSHQVDLDHMVEDVDWVKSTVDGYAASWQEAGGEVDESRGVVRETWVPPNLARDGITPTMLETLIGGGGGLARIRPGKSVVYDRAYAELRDGGYVALKRATPGLSSGGDYYVLTDKGADLVRRYRLEVRKVGATWGSKVGESRRPQRIR